MTKKKSSIPITDNEQAIFIIPVITDHIKIVLASLPLKEN